MKLSKSLQAVTEISCSPPVKKTISILFFLFLFYIVPLAVRPVLMLHPKVLFLAGICTLLFATQTRLSIRESREKKSSDRNTVWMIMAVSGIGQVVSLVEWAYFNGSVGIPPTSLHLNFWTLAGTAMLLSGTLFRIYSIRVLGKYFSTTVQIIENHSIVTKGPYKLLRHPSYTGAYVAMLGSAIFLESFIGILIFGIGMLFVYHLRIKTEEQTLIQNFGNKYLNYQNHTYKMFPLVW